MCVWPSRSSQPPPPPHIHTHSQKQANVTGIWTPSTLQTTLTQLRALDSNVSKVLGSGCGGDGEAGKGTQASSFRLNMLAEVLSLVVPPLAEAVGEGMEVDG